MTIGDGVFGTPPVPETTAIVPSTNLINKWSWDGKPNSFNFIKPPGSGSESWKFQYRAAYEQIFVPNRIVTDRAMYSAYPGSNTPVLAAVLYSSHPVTGWPENLVARTASSGIVAGVTQLMPWVGGNITLEAGWYWIGLKRINNMSYTGWDTVRFSNQASGPSGMAHASGGGPRSLIVSDYYQKSTNYEEDVGVEQSLTGNVNLLPFVPSGNSDIGRGLHIGIRVSQVL